VRAESAYRGRPGPLAAALAQLEAWLLEPVPERAVTGASAQLPARPVVAVVGLGPGCGATTVARAVAASLASRDAAGAALVTGVAPPFAPVGRAASRLRLELRREGITATAAGRLCFCQPGDLERLSAEPRRFAPLVIDTASGSQASSAPDLTVVVAPATAEPSLVELFARSLPTRGSDPLVVVNRARDNGRWAGRASLFVPDSHLAARLAMAGLEPRGSFGRAISGLGRLVEVAACA
jgi:hypothetical protein